MSALLYSDAEFLSDSARMGNNDPLNALHSHVLAANPNLDTSCLTDDEMITLLKGANEPQDLAYLNIPLVKQASSGSISIRSPGLSSSLPSSQFSFVSRSESNIVVPTSEYPDLEDEDLDDLTEDELMALQNRLLAADPDLDLSVMTEHEIKVLLKNELRTLLSRDPAAADLTSRFDHCDVTSDSRPMGSNDPLNAAHEQALAARPDLNVSLLADDWSPMGKMDPLNALHNVVLAINPGLDTSVLCDDELIAVLKGTNDGVHPATANEPQSIPFRRRR